MSTTGPVQSLPVTSLNLGSGKDFRFDHFNIDVDESWYPDAVVDLSAVDCKNGAIVLETARFGRVELGQGSFDRIIANDVLEHVPNLMALMTSCLNLLRPGGTFEVSVPYDLSFGAWQDPTHIRAFNERSWLYYTDWFWYMGWDEARFTLDRLQFVPSPLGERLKQQGLSDEAVLSTPRAIDSMSVTLRKMPLSEADQDTWRHWRERRQQAKHRARAGASVIPQTMVVSGPSDRTESVSDLAPFPGEWSDHADRHCIWVVSPAGYDHHHAFAEVASGLSAAFAERGGSAPVVEHPSQWAGRLPIVLGAHLLSPNMALVLPKGSVIYNLEQVDRASNWLTDTYMGLLRRHAVLDYSRRNIVALKALGIRHAELLPLGYSDAINRVQTVAEQDIDVLFYGSLNERRAAVLDDLRAGGANVVHLFKVYGKERDDMIARAKIVLNMHFYDAAIFETTRVAYLLANGAFVVTEGKEGDPDIAPFKGGLGICDYSQIADLCRLLLGEDQVRRDVAQQGQALMRHYRQADRLGELFVPK